MTGDILSPRREHLAEEAARRVAELEAEIETLRQAQAELLLFAGQLAHDLRTPLAAALGFATILDRPLAEEAKQRSIERIRMNLERMSELIEMHLDAARRLTAETKAGSRVDLDLVVDWVLVTLADRIGETGAQFVRRPLPDVLGDEAGLRRLYQNLVDNVLTHRDPNRTPIIRLDAVREGHFWLLTVSDNGPGIPLDERSEVLRFRARADGESRGSMGLPTCRRVVESYGGDLWIEDGPNGIGARVAFTLAAPD